MKESARQIALKSAETLIRENSGMYYGKRVETRSLVLMQEYSHYPLQNSINREEPS